MKTTKNKKAILTNDKIDKNKFYSPSEAIEIIKSISTSKFDETIDLSIQLGIDPKKSDQQIKIATVPPNPLGKKVRVVAICNGEHVKKAESSGADYVGGEDMIEKIINEKWTDFDVLVSIPEMMPKIAKLGQVLGPKRLMPSPKMGTVTNDMEKAIKDAKAGRIEIKNDKLGLVNFPCGKKSFEIAKIMDNLYFLVQSINKSKPASSKGNYFKKVSVSSTMGPGFKIDVALLKEELKKYNGAVA